MCTDRAPRHDDASFSSASPGGAITAVRTVLPNPTSPTATRTNPSFPQFRNEFTTSQWYPPLV